ncbi:hypothetical protein AT574_02310 [Phaeobacter inhibens]|nr:hypothetical protein AT574_02310 [Phaeobacter inhibens]
MVVDLTDRVTGQEIWLLAEMILTSFVCTRSLNTASFDTEKVTTPVPDLLRKSMLFVILMSHHLIKFAIATINVETFP